MRKVAFLNSQIDTVQKLMIYECPDEVLLFGYDCLQDSSAIWDNWYANAVAAEEYCLKTYGITQDMWILIADPCDDCQHDYIMPTRIKGRDQNKPEWGQLQTLSTGKWVDAKKKDHYTDFDGLTGNERLFISGLIDEFAIAKSKDKNKAMKILTALQIDQESIKRIIA